MGTDLAKLEKLVILGAGPAGLTAAIYAARADLQPLCIEGEQPGGQLTLTSEVENYPGFPDGILGPELMQAFRRQAEKLGTRFYNETIHHIKLEEEGVFELGGEGGLALRAQSVIIATGASAKWLGLANEKKLRGKGVSACATCDGFFFRGLPVGVIGGGDTAMEEALFLTRFASKVTLIHRRKTFRASKVMQDRVLKHPKIEVLWNTEVVDFLGDTALTGLSVYDSQIRKTRLLEVQGAFVAIGHQPNTQFLGTLLPRNPAGYLITQPGSTSTQLPGLFAAGDVADWTYRQAVTAAGTGCMAALEAERYLDGLEA